MSQSDRIIGGRYVINQLIGRGGMAEVHIGNDTRLNRIVAIKILRQDLARDPVFQARFRREAQSAANLNHPSIVAVYDTGEETITASDGVEIKVPYIVMEYVEGHTVRELLTDGNPVPLEEAVEIVSGVLDALEYAHHQNLVHRDIKPGNVMITTTGKIKVMDFGIARALSDSQATMTQTDAVVGTAQYLSPEQARGEQVDARSDLYSAGCLLFELLTGQPPFKGDSAVAVAFQHVSQLPPLPSSIAPDIPESLDRVVMKALAKNREDRYPDAAHMRADLQASLHGGNVAAPATATWTAPLAGDATGATTVLPPVNQGYAGYGAPRTSAMAPAGQNQPTQTLDATDPTQDKRAKSRKKALIIVIVLLAILAALGLGYWLVFNQDKPNDEMVEIPSLDGMNQEEASAAITDAGLVFRLGRGVSSEDIPEGIFVKSDPAVGTKVAKGSKVFVSLSTGPGDASVPSLAGLTQEQARKALEAEGLEIGNITTVDSGTVDKDKVIKSNPAEGEAVKQGDSVDLEVASGNFRIPQDLVGSTKDALQKFANANRVRLTIAEKEDSTVEPGTVLSLDKAGQLVGLDTSMTAVVAIAPKEPTPKPETPTDTPSAPAEPSRAPETPAT
ncbi:Stk1 family PASTA domain-containing Ser/Thr kinase [Mobiluncus curtisii]|uniref:non-specific serine/threonine protein kinase n=2 Tax=Mobiluncus curtisii TaxID=2051 RepID=A0A7Y0UF65_9ACTO|nr:Stk1 family PASTA domain-containing Ser/Thr kinase [Mobiluncus curtisii]EFL93529.1 kinase domain protein [Mobiluncus curtisii subsp. curtisii ATCC 35241]MCU9987318.1 Stk1 family PASTA domain-containing Ser/Thr kinase [Mobiluncus curtisii]NMW49934.1 Stk1 family PASTA domain-containing Ser/Thr kinase [Mobiluncus curtisii]NMW86177.1 Stk1 family PASTA domain-containing Ser/Thr kinase [Mobiluncus curtisii]QQT13975.1 Stk1 family PASTA domain-containing Ser/Thr kinase [Mobiluncus curtisii]